MEDYWMSENPAVNNVRDHWTGFSMAGLPHLFYSLIHQSIHPVINSSINLYKKEFKS
jgi:hypothetical protein